MKLFDLTPENIDQVVNLLKAGKIGIMPTDTIYGIVGLALNPQTVEKIYLLRKRGTDKPMIILISGLTDLNYFNILLTPEQKSFLEKNWPEPLSVVLSCPSEKFRYLHRGKNSLAFRVPKNEMMLKVIKEVGPLVAPSANLEGDKPAENIDQAKESFNKSVSFYVDAGRLESKPSTIIQLYEDGKKVVLREGSFKVKC